MTDLEQERKEKIYDMVEALMIAEDQRDKALIRIKELEADLKNEAKRERERIIKGFDMIPGKGGFRCAVIEWPDDSYFAPAGVVVLGSESIRDLLEQEP